MNNIQNKQNRERIRTIRFRVIGLNNYRKATDWYTGNAKVKKYEKKYLDLLINQIAATVLGTATVPELHLAGIFGFFIVNLGIFQMSRLRFLMVRTRSVSLPACGMAEPWLTVASNCDSVL